MVHRKNESSYDDGWKKLLSGNKRFVKGEIYQYLSNLFFNVNSEKRIKLLKEQNKQQEIIDADTIPKPITSN